MIPATPRSLPLVILSLFAGPQALAADAPAAEGGTGAEPPGREEASPGAGEQAKPPSAQRKEEDGEKGRSVKHLTMEEIMVTDEAMAQATSTRVGVKTIERGKNTTIPDVLEREAEIDVSRRAAVGDTGDTLKIRGLSGNRIMLNIDGRSVNAAGVQGGYFIDWSTIPLDNIEKIEVMYGGSSVKYGNNAGGGVINVITRRPSEKPTVAAYANYADVSHAQDYRLTHSYKIGPVGYAVAGSYQRANAFLWNNDYQAKNIEGKFYVDMPLEGSLTAGVQYTDVERGFTLNNRRSSNPNDPGFFQKITPDFPLSFGESFSPGAGNVTTPGPGADWNKKKVLLDVGYAQPIGRALVELKFYKNWEDRRERNYSASSINSAYSDGALVLDRTVKSDRSYGASGELSMPIGRHDVDAGAEYKVISTGGQDIHSVDTAYGVRGSVTSSAGSSANMWGFYAQDGWSVTDDLLLTPGIRYDIYDGPAEGAATGAGRLKERDLSLSLSGTYRLTRSDTLTASIYRKVVTPSAPDAWWWSEGFGTFYTTDLKAEKNHAVEVTYQHDFWSRASAKLSAYGYRIDDYIKRFSRPEGRGCYNIGKVFLYGVSAAATAKVFSWMSVWGNATYQKSKTAGDPLDPARVSDELEYLPRWKGNLGVDFRLPFGATLGVRERIVGVSRTVYSFSQRGATSYRLIGLASYATTDVELKVPVTKNGEVGVYAENLFDKRYEERFGYALPGLDVGASAKFTY